MSSVCLHVCMHTTFVPGAEITIISHETGMALRAFWMLGKQAYRNWAKWAISPTPTQNKISTLIVFQIVVIMRGLPGSGKTHVAKLIRVSMGKQKKEKLVLVGSMLFVPVAPIWSVLEAIDP